MLVCKKCGVEVFGDKRCCPLCQGELAGTPEPEREAFPKTPPPKYDRGMLRKVLNFAAIVSAAVCLAVEFAFTPGSLWILSALGGIFCGWLTISVAITFRTRIFKNLTCELLLLTILCVIWDGCTGWRGWSVNYLLPVCCTLTMVADLILAKVLKAEESEYLIHLTIVTVYSLIPFILMACGVIQARIPAFICTVMAFLVIAALIVFRTRAFFAELSRRMHI